PVKSKFFPATYAIILSLCPQIAFGYTDGLLAHGDDAVLAAPVTDFKIELQRIQLPPAQYQAIPTVYDHVVDEITSDRDDLLAALKASGKSADAAERIADAYKAERTKLKEFE